MRKVSWDDRRVLLSLAHRHDSCRVDGKGCSTHRLVSLVFERDFHSVVGPLADHQVEHFLLLEQPARGVALGALDGDRLRAPLDEK